MTWRETTLLREKKDGKYLNVILGVSEKKDPKWSEVVFLEILS